MSTKIEALVGHVAQPFQYGNVFSREEVRGIGRTRIALDREHVACLRSFLGCLAEPFQLLYVLHTSRTGAKLGRYESPDLTFKEVQAFLAKFGGFLSGDSRHDFWLRSHGDDATIVWDRHNLIYAYGPLDAFEVALRSLGARADAPPSIPAPHVHHYHPEWDDSERAVLRAFDWTVKALRESDEQ